jgi:uncharacterized protein HemX
LDCGGPDGLARVIIDIPSANSLLTGLDLSVNNSTGVSWTMAEKDILSNQKVILKNQSTILKNQSTLLGNQDTIKKNQGIIKDNQKSILANQKDIKANQKDIKKNQESLDLILKNQERIVALLQK